MASDLNELGQSISAALPGAVLSQKITLGELTLGIEPNEIVRAVKLLRDDPKFGFTVLIDVCGVDWPNRAKRFDVVYHLLSLTHNRRIRLKVETDEETPVPSIAGGLLAPNGFGPGTFPLYGIGWQPLHSPRRRSPAQAPPSFSPPSSRIPVAPGIRSARTFRSPASSSCATT